MPKRTAGYTGLGGYFTVKSGNCGHKTSTHANFTEMGKAIIRFIGTHNQNLKPISASYVSNEKLFKYLFGTPTPASKGAFTSEINALSNLEIVSITKKRLASSQFIVNAYELTEKGQKVFLELEELKPKSKLPDVILLPAP